MQDLDGELVVNNVQELDQNLYDGLSHDGLDVLSQTVDVSFNELVETLAQLLVVLKQPVQIELHRFGVDPLAVSGVDLEVLFAVLEDASTG